MTVSERIQSQSFAYDPQFPPDVAAGLPLTACDRPHVQPPALKRALRTCRRAVSLRRR